jgi:type III restriction enzyme
LPIYITRRQYTSPFRDTTTLAPVGAPILWQSDGREYNPDFVAVAGDGVHWLVEAKMDKEMESADVAGKENAALRWANHVSAKTDKTWRYLLASESSIAEARGSWSALKSRAL